jgi:GntR family transcriptional regulator, carbon starvation induced regulator
MTDASRVRRSTLTEQIENIVRTDIIEGRLKPGQRLIASELSLRYSVSATPLREALQRLASQNLVEIDPHLGAAVAPISAADLQDTYWIRELLESLAVRRSVARGDDAWEAELRTSFVAFEAAVGGDHNDVERWSGAHRAFHAALMSACGSPWLLKLLNVITDHSERYRMLSVKTGFREPIAEHSAIFAAAMARNEERAVRTLQQHLDRTVEVIEESLSHDNLNASPDGTGGSGVTGDAATEQTVPA